MLEMWCDRVGERRLARQAPRRRRDVRLLEPAFCLVHGLHAISGFARLKVESLGAHAIVERRDRDELAVARLHNGQRRGHSAGFAGSEQIATAEWIPEQELVVTRIEER